jgi:hypothetical protein
MSGIDGRILDPVARSAAQAARRVAQALAHSIGVKDDENSIDNNANDFDDNDNGIDDNDFDDNANDFDDIDNENDNNENDFDDNDIGIKDEDLYGTDEEQKNRDQSTLDDGLVDDAPPIPLHTAVGLRAATPHPSRVFFLFSYVIFYSLLTFTSRTLARLCRLTALSIIIHSRLDRDTVLLLARTLRLPVCLKYSFFFLISFPILC